MGSPPFGIIADLLRKGKVVPFLGAGVNSRPKKATWSPDASFLPYGGELSERLAALAEFPAVDTYERRDLAKVSSYVVDVSGRAWLREHLREVFAREYEPCDIHSYFAENSSNLLIITTNYDDLLEQAFQQAGRPFTTIVHAGDNEEFPGALFVWRPESPDPEIVAPRRLRVNLARTSVIYKMHGTVRRADKETPRDDAPADRWDSFVITEDDYINFLSGMTATPVIPPALMQHMRDKQFLFLGYGLGDWNWRVVLRNVRPESKAAAHNARERRPSWAIQYHPRPSEEALWDARNVNIYDMPIQEFVKRLREAP